MIIHNPILTGSFTVNGTDVASITSSAASITAINSYTASQNILNGTYATTGSNTFAGIQTVNSNLVVTGSITAQTLVVQTVSSSVIYSSGSNVFGNNIANTQTFTGSVSMTGSLAVVTNGTEFQVTSTGVNLGNALTDSHVISGSFRVNPNGLFVSSSGNVGIRTNSPISLLSLGSGFGASAGLASNVKLAVYDNGTVSDTYGFGISLSTFEIHSAENVAFYTGQSSTRTERMRITSGGNVGIGTTTTSGRLDVQAPGTSAFSYYFRNSNGGYTGGVYNTGANHAQLYLATSAGTENILLNSTGSSYFNGGNIGIGTSSPSINLHITSAGMTLSSTTTYSSATTKGIVIEATNGATDVGSGIWFNNSQLYAGIGSARSNVNNWGTDLRFFTHPDTTSNQYDLTERMRITSGGNVGIGTSSPQAELDVVDPSYNQYTLRVQSAAGNNANGWGGIGFSGEGANTKAAILFLSDGGSYSRGSLIFCNNNDFNQNSATPSNERMRITSGGQVCINRTSGGGELNVQGTIYLYLTTAGAGNSTLKYNTSTGAVTYDSSARAYKKDIQSLNYGLSEVLQMSPKKYKYISNDTNDIGFIADEMYEIVPEIVALANNEITSGDFENGEPISINYDRLTPILVKAIQELNTKFEEYKATHP